MEFEAGALLQLAITEKQAEDRTFCNFQTTTSTRPVLSLLNTTQWPL